MIILTEDEAKAIHAIERESFERYCQLILQEPSDYQNVLVQEIRQSITAHFDALPPGIPKPDEAWLRSNCPVLFIDDYWQAREYLTSGHRKLVVAAIIGARHSVIINEDYLRRVARERGFVCPELIDDGWLTRFLESCPTILLCEMDFNAFVSRRSEIRNVPSVTFSDLLHASLQNLIMSTLQVAVDFSPDGTADVRSVEEAGALARTPVFREALRASIQMLLCESARIDLPVSIRTFGGSRRSQLMPIMQAVAAAQNFVWFHEFGHILKGHLLGGPCPQYEYEADAFAVAVTTDPTAPRGMLTWSFLGVVLLLLALRILERRYGDSPSDTHPPVLDRLSQILGRIEQRNLTFSRIAASATAAFNAVLNDHWGFTI